MKKFLCAAAILFFFCVSFAGCSVEVESSQSDDGESDYYFYYTDAAFVELKREPYTPGEEKTDFMVRDLMQRLGNREKDGNDGNLLPEEVSVNSYDLKDALLIIDFNEAYNALSRPREVLLRAGVVNTFLQIPDITMVRFTVNGKSLRNSRNEEVGNMTNGTFVEYSYDDEETYRYDTFTLYFADSSGEHLVKEKRNVYYKRSLTRQQVVLEQLSRGPMEKGSYPTISGNASVTGSTISDDICYVGMNNAFRDNTLDVTEEVMVYSVVNSLVDACGVDKVQIYTEDAVDGMFRENLPVYSFYEKNQNLVKEEDDQE